MKLTRGEILSRLRESSRVNCINWKGCTIRSGDNVLFRNNAQQLPTLQPGQVIDILDYRDIPKGERSSVQVKPKDGRERFVLIRHRSFLSGKEVPRLDPVKYSHLPDLVKEVADTVEVEWLACTNVSTFCFIFHADTIQRGVFTCKGIERLFFIRYQKTRSGKLIPLKECNWNAFYRDALFPGIESFPEAIWNNIVTVKQEVQRAMSRGGQWDGRTVSAKIVGVQPSFFSFMKDEFEELYDNEILLKSFRVTRSRKVMFDSLAATRQKVKVQGEFVRILFEDELVAVRKVFGVTFGVGITHPVPSLKMLRANPSLKATAWLRNDDLVRIVSCSANRQDIDLSRVKPIYRSSGTGLKDRPTKVMCSYRGMDLKFNQVKYSVPEISVQCRFIKARGDSEVVKDLIGRKACDGNHSDSESSGVIVAKGDYLTLEGPRVVVIREITPNGMVRCVSPGMFPVNDAIEITMEEATAGLLRQCS